MVDFHLRVNRHRKRKIVWKDSLADDYIHRPVSSQFESVCSYEMAMKFKKKFLTFKQMKAIEERLSNINGLCDDDEYNKNENQVYADLFSGDIFEFQHSHPGSKFSHLAELNHEVIPKYHFHQGNCATMKCYI